jgi:hypothetical protein
MCPRILRLFKRAFQLPRLKRDQTQLQRQLYQSLKTKYTRGSAAVRANMRANARALIATPSAT